MEKLAPIQHRLLRLQESQGEAHLGTSRGNEHRTAYSAFERLYWKQGQLTAIQFYAGERFRGHWYLASMAGEITSVNYDRVHGGSLGSACGMPRNEFEADNRLHYRAAIGTLDKFSPGLAQTITEIVCEDKPLIIVGEACGRIERHKKMETALTRLQLGLDALAGLWRMFPIRS